MAVPFFLPEGGTDDIASSSGGNSGASSSSASSSSSSGSSSGASTSSGASDGASSIASQSPNTTTSATQTPMPSPLTMPTDQVLTALCEWYQQHLRYNYNTTNTAPHIFQYPTPPSPSCSMAQSPSYTGADVFFAHGNHVPPRTPRTSISFAAGEELNFFRQPYPAPSTPQPMPRQPQSAPQSAPPMHYSHSYPQQSTHLLQHHPASYGHPLPAGAYYATYTPPPTPNTANASTSTSASPSYFSGAASYGRHGHGPALASTPLAPNGPKMRLQRSQSDAARRKRLTSTGEDEREYQSDHETSWDEFDDRYDNFTAGRERLQEFSGRIPPRKKKSNNGNNNNGNSTASTHNANSCATESNHNNNNNNNHNQSQSQQQRESEAQQKKPQSFTWPTVVTVFVLAMGCGFFAAR